MTRGGAVSGGVERTDEAMDMKMDGTPFVWTEKLTRLRFGGERSPNGCACKLCGERIKVGEAARFMFCNDRRDLHCPNFFAHAACIDKIGSDEAAKLAASEKYKNAVALARLWNIYGPDWQRQS